MLLNAFSGSIQLERDIRINACTPLLCEVPGAP